MISPATRSRLIGMAVYVAACMAILFFRLLPVSPGSVFLPGPDVALCLTLAWVLRRPDQLPALIIAAVFLVEDLMLGRPPGLWAFFVLIGSEALRRRAQAWRDLPVLLEWARVAALAGLLMLGYRAMMAVFMLPLTALGQTLLQMVATAAAYPVVVLAARWLLGLRRLGQGEQELSYR